MKLKGKYIWVVFALILVDSKVDKSLSRLPRLYTQMQSALTESGVDISNFSKKAGIWEEVKAKQGTIKVISDDFNEHYYAPRGTILHSVECTVQGMVLKRCNQKDFRKLQSYDYAILKDRTKNECYQLIRSQSALKEIGDYKLYRLN